jgi:hypothetical protein
MQAAPFSGPEHGAAEERLGHERVIASAQAEGAVVAGTPVEAGAQRVVVVGRSVGEVFT